MYLVYVQVARPFTARNKQAFLKTCWTSSVKENNEKNCIRTLIARGHAAMLSITLWGNCENWQSSWIHEDIIGILGFMFIIRYPYSHQYNRVIVIVYWSEYPDRVIIGIADYKHKTKYINDVFMYGPFRKCQSLSFITVHGQLWSNRLGLNCQVIIWPRKHNNKTPSQASTRFKQIYRTGWSLKCCGTVHWTWLSIFAFTW